MTLRNWIFFFFNVQFKKNRRKYLHNPLYSYLKAVTAASREEMGGNSSEKRRHSSKIQMGIYLWPLKEMETGCSFTSPRLLFYPMLLFFPIYFFLSLCVPLHVSNSHSSLSLNRENDKNLKPIPIWKGTLCQTPLPSVDVLGGEVHGCVDTDSSLLFFHSTTRNSLRFMGAQDHSLQLTQRQCLLCPFSSPALAGPGTMGSCGSAVANTPNWLALQCELLHSLHCGHLPNWCVLDP